MVKIVPEQDNFSIKLVRFSDLQRKGDVWEFWEFLDCKVSAKLLSPVFIVSRISRDLHINGVNSFSKVTCLDTKSKSAHYALNASGSTTAH